MEGRKPAGPADCLSAEAWEEVVAGVWAPREAEAWLAHAVGCQSCEARLRRAVDALGDLGPDDATAELDRLPSSHPYGRRRIVQQLLELQQARRKPAPGARRWRLAAASALAAGTVVVVGLLTLPRWGRAYLAQSLVQRAYAKHRVLPLRLAGASYAPLFAARRGAATALPPELLEAEGLLAAGLEARPGDPQLLRIQAQADLVAGNAPAAITDLRQALRAQPQTPGVMIDLASAYFESATEGRDADYGQALELLSRALTLAPKNAVARYNRALVEEALQDWTGAIADWTAYLQLDARGVWAAEARQHLQQARRQVYQHGDGVGAPLL